MIEPSGSTLAPASSGEAGEEAAEVLDHDVALAERARRRRTRAGPCAVASTTAGPAARPPVGRRSAEHGGEVGEADRLAARASTARRPSTLTTAPRPGAGSAVAVECIGSA